ncbi:MAG: DUF3106 domain-containing protein [Opitutaceae bacterium]|nr:DUF3106 domain-containing protein [Opitutaceae bacterium]
MKSMLIVGWWLGAALVVLPTSVRAQGGPPPWAGQGGGPHASRDAGAGDDEFAALERFLAMSDAELDEMQQAIARVRAMTPEQRAQLRAQIAAFHQLPAERRDEIRGGWGWHDARDRDDWRTMMHAKPPEERAAVQAELQALPADQRLARKRALLEAWRQADAGKTDTQAKPSP